MAITAAEIKLLLSGGAANTNPDLSLGGAVSATDTPANQFDRVTSTEASTGDSEYRCSYVKNTHATLTMVNTHLWITANTVSADTNIQIGLGTSAINGVEQTIADENTAPTGVTFSDAATEGAAITVGDLAPGQTKAIWWKRIVNAAAAASNDTYNTRIKCDTLP